MRSVRTAWAFASVLLAGCAAPLSAPPEDLRIGPADVLSPVAEDRP
jgi:hypothetical protein